MTPPPEMAERARAVLREVLDETKQPRAASAVRRDETVEVWSDDALAAMLTFATREVERERERCAGIAAEAKNKHSEYYRLMDADGNHKARDRQGDLGVAASLIEQQIRNWRK